MTQVLRGNIVHAPKMGELSILEHGYMVLEDGVIRGVYPTLPEELAQAEVRDYGDRLLMQSFADMHLHAPQYPMLGMGMDLPLLDWLSTYTFPTEARFADTDYARRVYRRLAGDLITSGTTRVCMFSSLHTEATWILMDEMERAGVTGYVGKVSMDRNGLPGVLQETTEESIRETVRWLDGCHFEHVKPILTPRFTPSCTDELMTALGQLARERGLYVQSHLSENTREIQLVRELHPDCAQYWETYDKYGLWKDRTLMAHCVHSDERERKAIRDAGVVVVHCADSNVNICSGLCPVRQMVKEGLWVTLGSDIAGGAQLPMYKVITMSIRTSKARRVTDEWHPDFLTVPAAVLALTVFCALLASGATRDVPARLLLLRFVAFTLAFMVVFDLTWAAKWALAAAVMGIDTVARSVVFSSRGWAAFFAIAICVGLRSALARRRPAV